MSGPSRMAWPGGSGVEGGTVLSVNVGATRTVRWRGRAVSTAIWKEPVEGRVTIRGVNVAGDDQADRTVHGGPDMAIYAYAHEDESWWTAAIGRTIGAGTFGENLTTTGIDVTNAVIGERWAIGDVELEVSQPRVPCYKLGIRMDDPSFPRRFAEAGRPGAYLRIIHPGSIAAGDPIRILSRPAHGVTIALVDRAYHEDERLVARLLDAPQLSATWTDWARHRLSVRAEVERSRVSVR